MRLRHFLFILTFVCELLLTLLLVTPGFAKDVLMVEGEVSLSILGAKSTERVASQANRFYSRWILEPDVEARLKGFFLPDPKADLRTYGAEPIADPLFKHTVRMIEVFLLICYWFFWRLALVTNLGIVFLPVIIISVIVGTIERNLRSVSFTFSSPFIQRVSKTITLWIFPSAVLLFCAPIPVAPVLIPAMLFMFCVTLRLSVTHLGKRL